MLFSERPRWIARNPVLRRAAVQLWRGVLRAKRATGADAVLVARSDDGRILVVREPSGDLRLPSKPLDALFPITTQVEHWLKEMLGHHAAPALVAIDGTPSRRGVTFLYAATVEAAAAAKGGDLWVKPAVADLGSTDRRLLLLCEERPKV